MPGTWLSNLLLLNLTRLMKVHTRHFLPISCFTVQMSLQSKNLLYYLVIIPYLFAFLSKNQGEKMADLTVFPKFSTSLYLLW